MATKRKPKPPPDDPAQSARFVETAKELEADKGGSAFARAMKELAPKKIVPKKPNRKPAPP
jgi:hypothetical protein